MDGIAAYATDNRMKAYYLYLYTILDRFVLSVNYLLFAVTSNLMYTQTVIATLRELFHQTVYKCILFTLHLAIAFQLKFIAILLKTMLEFIFIPLLHR